MVMFGSTSDPANDAVRQMADDPRLLGLLTDVLASCWRRCGLPFADLPAILAAAIADPDDATAAAHRAAAYLRTRPGTFGTAYGNARAAKFDGFADLLGPMVRPGLICDIGAGDTQLVQRLSTVNPANSKFIATDVTGSPCVAGAVSVARQPAPDRLPLADDSASTVIATGMLHHMTPTTRRALLSDVRRVLEHGGRLLLLEETFPAAAWTPHSELDARFQSLDEHGRWAFLAVTDWWGNRVMKNLPNEPLPCTFMDIAELEQVLAESGLAVGIATYLGIRAFGGHMATPRALIVAEWTG